MATNEIVVHKGDTRALTLTFKDDSGTAINITGYTVFFTVKTEDDLADANDDDAIISKTVTSHTNAAGGITTVTLSNSDTDVTVGTYWYDIQLKDGTGSISTPSQFPAVFRVIQDVTRRNI